MKKLKVLFIYPNAGSQTGFNYGVAHLAGVLGAAGHSSELIQLCEEIAPLPTEAEFKARLREIKPDVIGFSVVTNQWGYAKELASWARTPGRPLLVCGGIHATVATEEVLKSGLFDYVFVGECEDAFLEFCDNVAAGRDVRGIRNLAFMDGGKPRINPVRPMPDLAALPPKDYGIFNFQKLIDAKRGWVGLMASRGCPFACTYCFNHLMVRKYRGDLKCSFKELNYIRRFPVVQVISEIKRLLAGYSNISMFIFDDDLFTYDKKYLLEFCREYRKATTLPFVVNAHVGFFDDEMAAALAAANCRIVKFGVESGSERIRRHVMNRHMSNEAIIDAIGTVNRHGMHSSVFIMVGLPQETEEDLMATVRLMAASKPGRFRWTYFFPYPGTESHRLAVEGGFVDEEKMKRLVNFTDESCLRFGAEQDLLLKKVGKIMPWFVNAESDLPCSPRYRTLTDAILAMGEARWEEYSKSALSEDKAVSLEMQKAGLPHYAVRYNPFMGVISDYFLSEK